MSACVLKKERVSVRRAFNHCAGQCLKSAEVRGGATAGNNCDEQFLFLSSNEQQLKIDCRYELCNVFISLRIYVIT